MSFEMNGDNAATIYLYDEIGGFFGGVTAKDFAGWMGSIGSVEQLDVRINSMGGSIFDGVAIGNLLRQNDANVTVWVDGVAASIASVIAMAGDSIKMAGNSFLMIHEPWTMISGTANQLRAEADTLDKLQEASVEAYTRKSGLSESEVLKMMVDTETWLTAAESVEKGFADEVVETQRAAALMIDRNIFPNAPSHFEHKPMGGKAPEKADHAKSEAAARAFAVRMRLIEVLQSA